MPIVDHGIGAGQWSPSSARGLPAAFLPMCMSSGVHLEALLNILNIRKGNSEEVAAGSSWICQVMNAKATNK